MPSEIGRLSNLGRFEEALSLSSDKHLLTPFYTELIGFTEARFGGTLPSEMGNLTSLRKVLMSRMKKLSGTVPSELGRLSNLGKLLKQGDLRFA